MSATPPHNNPKLPGRPKMLSHLAYITHDVEATATFYETVMGMPLVESVISDRVPSTGDAFPYLHVFFRLDDGSTLAFFEVPGLPPANPKGHAAYDVLDHLAFEVSGTEVVDQWHAWLSSNGLDVVGPVDHSIIYSIYFRDPVNDIRLEITTPLVADWNDRSDQAKRDVAEWIGVKRTALEQEQDVSEALIKFIDSRRAAAH